jgi:hypothetical protein
MLEKYGLGKVEEYLHSPKAKEVWKIIVKKHQNKFCYVSSLNNLLFSGGAVYVFYLILYRQV